MGVDDEEAERREEEAVGEEEGKLLAKKEEASEEEESEEEEEKRQDGDDDASAPSNGAVSKNALKRQRRQEVQQAKKKYKKAVEKERKKARKAFAAANNASARDTNTIAPTILPARPRSEINLEKKAEYLRKSSQNFSVIIDCAWNDHLVGRPLISLAQQILFCYGVNRRAANPCTIYVTGINKLLRDQLEKSSMSSWLAVHPYKEDYIALPFFATSIAGVGSDESGIGSSSSSSGSGSSKGDGDGEPAPPRVKRLVYLTSDAEETIQTLDPDAAYIIGGIVDRNSMKGATFGKAQRQGVSTAKLPIKEHMEMSASHVLTVNHVFEILMQYCSNGGSWKDAIAKTLPQRKGAKTRGEGEASSGPEGETGEEGRSSACDGGTEDNQDDQDDQDDEKDL